MYSRAYSCNLFNIITMNDTNTLLCILYQKLVMCRFEHHFIEHQTISNIIFRTSDELKNVHLLVIELEHPIFGFERAFNRFTELLKQQTRTLVFCTSNKLERVHLLVIELKHLIFGFER